MRNIQKYMLILIFFKFNFKLCDSQCDKTEWECKNGKCIPHDELCDGHRDCSDGSDEVSEKCLHLQCPKYSFKCSYGACVGGSAVCNNIKDCDDDSDEATGLCEGVQNTSEKKTSSEKVCDDDSFKCANGQCISYDIACDGKKDCSDGSDETVQLCGGSLCPAFAFRCAYGACINGDKKCNGEIDCFDGSDENDNLCPRASTQQPRKTTKPTTSHRPPSGCLVTFRPNLIVKSESDNPQEIIPGNYVGNYEGISYSCHEGNILVGATTNYCFDSKWSENMPECKKYCSNSVLRSVTIQSTCVLNGTRVSCELPILPATRVTIACQFGYQKIVFDGQDNLYCGDNGEWDYPPYRCRQVCGEYHPDFKPFILGGSKTNITKVPWHVGIYSNLEKPNQQICGGTIVSARIVISAAHCFWNTSNSKVNDKSLYMVGAGKYYRDYSAKEPLEAQFSDLVKIHISEDYKDIQLSYISDIAVLVLKTYLEFTYYIKPACIKWEQYSEKAIKSNVIGRVAGWGKTEKNTASNELITADLPTLSYADCLANTQKEYKNMITGDKFCASNKEGQTVCQGDSGGGFVIPQEDINGGKRFVLQGIVSNGITSNDECAGDFLTAYTNIQYFEQMVESYMDEYRVN